MAAELVMPVAAALRKKGVPFVVASAYAKAEQYGRNVLAGVPNADKPMNERRALATLDRLLAR